MYIHIYIYIYIHTYTYTRASRAGASAPRSEGRESIGWRYFSSPTSYLIRPHVFSTALLV